jgi:hypothetical protein
MVYANVKTRVTSVLRQRTFRQGFLFSAIAVVKFRETISVRSQMLPSKPQMSELRPLPLCITAGPRSNFRNTKQKDTNIRLVSILSVFILRYYSYLRCIIDNITYITYKTINRSTISHISNYSSILGSWFRASFSTYVYKYPTRCNNCVLFYCEITVHVSGTLRAHHQQLTVTGITYVTLDREFCGNVHF